MAAGSDFLGGLELAGPYMFLLTGAVGEVIAVGIWRLHNWARWMAILVAMIGVVLLVPAVSSAMLDFQIGKLAWGGLATIMRVMIVWYLWQPPVRDAFNRDSYT